MIILIIVAECQIKLCSLCFNYRMRPRTKSPVIGQSKQSVRKSSNRAAPSPPFVEVGFEGELGGPVLSLTSGSPNSVPVPRTTSPLCVGPIPIRTTELVQDDEVFIQFTDICVPNTPTGSSCRRGKDTNDELTGLGNNDSLQTDFGESAFDSTSQHLPKKASRSNPRSASSSKSGEKNQAGNKKQDGHSTQVRSKKRDKGASGTSHQSKKEIYVRLKGEKSPLAKPASPSPLLQDQTPPYLELCL